MGHFGEPVSLATLLPRVPEGYQFLTYLCQANTADKIVNSFGNEKTEAKIL